MEKISLYEIAGSMKQLELMEAEGLNEYLDSLQIQLQEKTENIIRYRQSLTMSADAIGNEIERLLKLKNGLVSKANALEGYLSYTMQKNEIEKISTSIANISFRKSQAVEITDEVLIPVEYRKVKTTESIDKMKIKEDLKKGIEIKGAVLKSNKNLVIK